MSDYNYRFTVFFKVFDYFQELIDFIRSQNSGWLIKNENFSASVKSFQNFNFLLHSNGNIPDFSFEVNFHPVSFDDFFNLFLCFPCVNDAEFISRFIPKDYILHNGKFVN